MFNSYLWSCEQAVANSLPDSRSHCSTFFPSHPPWCEPERTAALECPRWNSSECPFDLTHHLVSAQGTHSIINNWTMATADLNGCCDPGLMTGMVTYIHRQGNPMALIPPLAMAFLLQWWKGSLGGILFELSAAKEGVITMRIIF